MFTSSSRRAALGAATLGAGLVLVLAGCGTDDSSTASGASSAASSGMAGMDHGGGSAAPSSATRTDFVDADVTFLQMMYPHHAQAVEMAKLAPGRSQNAQLLALATAIDKAQGPEMTKIAGLLKDFGQPAPAASGDHASMSGMMSPDQMASLQKLSGAAFDREWLQMMIEHHTGAVAMANTEVASGANNDAKALARSIIANQQTEITQMRAMLARS